MKETKKTENEVVIFSDAVRRQLVYDVFVAKINCGARYEISMLEGRKTRCSCTQSRIT